MYLKSVYLYMLSLLVLAPRSDLQLLPTPNPVMNVHILHQDASGSHNLLSHTHRRKLHLCPKKIQSVLKMSVKAVSSSSTLVPQWSCSLVLAN